MEQNKEKKKFDFKNISDEDKKKYVFLSILSIFCLIVGVGIYMYQNNEEEGENVDFSNGKADLIEYNNKLDALRGKEIDSTDNLAYTFEGNSTPNYEAIDRQIAELGNSTPQPNPNTSVSNSSPQNNHNVYGDYNMWQTNEPKGSNIGYRETSNRATTQTQSKKSKEIKHTTPVYEEVEVERPKVVKTTPAPQQSARVIRTNGQGLSETEQRRMMLRTGKRNVENTANIKVNIDGDQVIKNGGIIKLKVMEDSFISNTFVPKYSIIYGRCSFGDGRVQIRVSSINVNNKIVQCNLEGYGTDGIQGLAVNIDAISGATKTAQEELDKTLNLNRSAVGRILSSLLSSKSKQDVKIKILNNQNLIFVQS